MQKECSRILQEVEKVIKGKEQEKKLILAAILAKGHILLDDIPGVGKTTLTMAFSRAMQLEFRNNLPETKFHEPAPVSFLYFYGSHKAYPPSHQSRHNSMDQ